MKIMPVKGRKVENEEPFAYQCDNCEHYDGDRWCSRWRFLTDYNSICEQYINNAGDK